MLVIYEKTKVIDCLSDDTVLKELNPKYKQVRIDYGTFDDEGNLIEPKPKTIVDIPGFQEAITQQELDDKVTAYVEKSEKVLKYTKAKELADSDGETEVSTRLQEELEKYS